MDNLFNMIDANIEMEYANESVTIDAMKMMSESRKELKAIKAKYKGINPETADKEELEDLISEMEEFKSNMKDMLAKFKAEAPSFGDKMLSHVIRLAPTYIALIVDAITNIATNATIIKRANVLQSAVFNSDEEREKLQEAVKIKNDETAKLGGKIGQLTLGATVGGIVHNKRTKMINNKYLDKKMGVGRSKRDPMIDSLLTQLYKAIDVVDDYIKYLKDCLKRK